VREPRETIPELSPVFDSGQLRVGNAVAPLVDDAPLQVAQKRQVFRRNNWLLPTILLTQDVLEDRILGICLSLKTIRH
jgi:hypothetical protein